MAEMPYATNRALSEYFNNITYNTNSIRNFLFSRCEVANKYS